MASSSAHGTPVFDQQHLSPLEGRFPGLRLVGPRPGAAAVACAWPRPEDAEAGALPEAALDPDQTAVLADDAVDGRQPETGAGALLLGGEERLEEVLEDLAVHPRAVVPHAELDERPRYDSRETARLFLAEPDVAGRDLDLSSPGHGVPGVESEVEEHLLELSGIALHRRRSGVERERDLEPLAEHPPEQAAPGPTLPVQVEAARRVHLAAARRVSSCPVSSAARRPARWISSTSRRQNGSPAGSRRKEQLAL